MAQPLHTHLQIQTAWDRPIVPLEGGTAILIAQILAASNIGAGVTRPPIDLAFVVDRSGSMSGEPLELVKEAVSVALDFVDDRDRVSLISFDDGVRIWHELAMATPTQKSLTRMCLRTITAGSSTNLAGGWMTGCHQLADSAPSEVRRVKRVILLTDGQANVGMTNPSDFSRQATTFREQGIATTTIGVSTHFDEQLLSAMAEAGGGNFMFVEHLRMLAGFFAAETGDLAKVVSVAPQLVLTLQPGVHGSLLNAFPTRISGPAMTIDLRDLIAGDDLVLVLEVSVPAGIADSLIAVKGELRMSDGTVLPIGIPEIRRRPMGEVAAHPADPMVVQRHAVEQSTRLRREAMRLDRDGDIAQSRQALRSAQSLLMSAPQSEEIDELTKSIGTLAESQVRFSESTRKQVVHDVHAQSRGRRR